MFDTEKYLHYFLTTFTSLFSIINPLGVIPIFLVLTRGQNLQYQTLMSRKASIYMVIILAFFLFAGTYFMKFFGISLEAIRVAGGFIVLRNGFLLLNPKVKDNTSLSRDSRLEALEKPDISLTPLAIPLLSGPGSMAATLSLATQATREFRLVIMGAIIVIGVITYFILSLSSRLMPFFGKSGLEAITKIMGFLSMTVGVQFILNGIGPFLKHLMNSH